jgi:hypothetical protein
MTEDVLQQAEEAAHMVSVVSGIDERLHVRQPQFPSRAHWPEFLGQAKQQARITWQEDIRGAARGKDASYLLQGALAV